MTVTGSSPGAAAPPAWRAGLPGFAAGPALAHRPGQPIWLAHLRFDGDAGGRAGDGHVSWPAP